MKSYIYTRTERTPRNGHTTYTLRLYHVVRGTPVFIGEDKDQFCSDFQQCQDLMRKLKVWPKKADVKDAAGRPKYYYPSQLREAGIVNINHI